MQKSVLAKHETDARGRWLYVIFGIAIMMCLGTVYSWSIFRSPIEKLFDIGSTMSGFPYMVSLLFYAITMVIAGKFLDRFNPRTIIIVGGLLVGGGWILSGFATNIYILTITYGLITGSGVGIVYGVPLSVVSKWFPEKKGLMVGLVLIGFGLSPFITAPVARKLIEMYGILTAFKVLGISFLSIIILLSLPFRYPVKTSNNSLVNSSHKGNSCADVDTKDMLKLKSFKGLYLCFLIGTMIGLTLIGITSGVGVELIKLDPKRVAILMSLFAVFNGIGRPFFGWLTDKLSPKNAMLTSYILIIFATLFMLVSGEGSFALYSIAFSLYWFNLGGWLAIAPTATLTMYGTKYYSENYGVIFSAYGIGAILGVSTSGILKDLFGNFDSVFSFVLLLSIIGILILNKFFPSKRK